MGRRGRGLLHELVSGTADGDAEGGSAGLAGSMSFIVIAVPSDLAAGMPPVQSAGKPALQSMLEGGAIKSGIARQFTASCGECKLGSIA